MTGNVTGGNLTSNQTDTRAETGNFYGDLAGMLVILLILTCFACCVMGQDKRRGGRAREASRTPNEPDAPAAGDRRGGPDV